MTHVVGGAPEALGGGDKGEGKLLVLHEQELFSIMQNLNLSESYSDR